MVVALTLILWQYPFKQCVSVDMHLRAPSSPLCLYAYIFSLAEERSQRGDTLRELKYMHDAADGMLVQLDLCLLVLHLCDGGFVRHQQMSEF